MKYCNTCGNLNPDNARKCLSCNAKFKKEHKTSTVIYNRRVPLIEELNEESVFKSPKQNFQSRTPKSMFIGVLAAFIPGIGHIYAGERRRGLQLLLMYLAVISLDVPMKIAGNWWIIPITSIGYTTLMAWSLVGTIKLIRQQNQYGMNSFQKSSIEGEIYPTSESKSKKAQEMPDFYTSESPQASVSVNKIPLATALFLVLPGIGQIMTGRKKRGGIFLGLFLGLAIIAIVIPLTTGFYQTIYFLNPIVALIFIIGHIDSFLQIKKHNLYIDQYGRKPTPTEFI